MSNHNMAANLASASPPPGAQGGVLRLAEDSIAELLLRHDSEATIHGLKRQLDQRRKFLSLVSHDLRSPMTIAKMCAEMIVSYPEDTESCKSRSIRIVEALSRADRMIKDLLDANRLQSGMSVTLRPTHMDLISHARKIVEEAGIIAPGRCVLEAHSLPAAIAGYWDPDLLRRALENLISNAIKYGDRKTQVTVYLVTLEGRVRIAVHNFGEPISSAEMGKLFRWFSRTASAEQAGIIGWGLGLMLVKSFVEAHGGSVGAESSRLKGTTFTIELPIDGRASAKPVKV